MPSYEAAISLNDLQSMMDRGGLQGFKEKTCAGMVVGALEATFCMFSKNMVFEAGLILQGMKVLFGGALVVLPVPGASSSDFRFNWYSILLSYFVGHMIRN